MAHLAFYRTAVAIVVITPFAATCRERPARPAASTPAAETDRTPPPSDGRVSFTDVTVRSGIDFRHSYGDTAFSNLVEAVGGGAVFLDYDGDGRLDLYVTSGKYDAAFSKGDAPRAPQRNRLYRGRADGTFTDVTEETGVALEGRFSTGVAAADYDNDGDTDLYVCNFGRSTLLRNESGRRFTDVTEAAGAGDDGRFAVAATFLDYDRDGHPDLYVANYIEFDPKYNLFYAPDGFPGPLSYPGQRHRLYRNQGDGTFRDVSAETGIDGHVGRGMGVVAVDYDDDGYQDLFVTNDATEKFLFHNLKGRRFEEVAVAAGVAYNGMGDSTASMAAEAADFDGDGRFDLFVSDNSFSSLLRNDAGGLFTDVVVDAGIAGPSASFVGWGAFFVDFDNDADLDLLKFNSDLSRLFGQEAQIFENDGRGRFKDMSDAHGDYFRQARLGRGACHGDYDNDGDLDLFLVNLGELAVLLRNDGGNGKPWLKVEIEGTRSGRDGLGARVMVEAAGRRQYAYRRSGSGYLSQNDPRLHFGLGAAARVDRVEVVWPSGETEVRRDVAVNQSVRFRENPR